MSVECPIECINRDLICESPPDWLEKHNGFLLALIGLMGGGGGVLFTYFLKSRCTKISCFGLNCTRQPIPLDPQDVEIAAAA